MGFLERDEDTICAVATPAGRGGIAVIRISGPEALPLSRKLCAFLPSIPDSHRAYHGWLKGLGSAEPIDEVLATYFAQGRSYTGEQTVEISCHGSPAIASSICQQLIQAGCRTAEPGEYTYRAFMNGRMDLVQAESVLSLIESESQASSKMALRQLQGELSRTIEDIEDQILWSLAHLEASIDFAHDHLDTAESAKVAEVLKAPLQKLALLRESYRGGRILRDGLRVVLMGAVNVGKSSLLNALTGQDAAIVTPIAGTTRDRVEISMTLRGSALQVVDTAGLRDAMDAVDAVEKLGMERSRKAAQSADMILHVVDGTQPLNWHWDYESQAPTVIVINKIDLVATEQRQRLAEQAKAHGFEPVMVSALSGQGLEELQQLLQKHACPVNVEQGAVVTQTRHFELLGVAQNHVREAHALSSREASPDLISFELQQALLAVQNILGKRFDDQILDRVFKEFCIGK